MPFLSIATLIFLIFKIFSSPICKEPLNHCFHCDVVTNLCSKCDMPDIFIPDENGGCKGAKNCIIGKNFCNECEENGKLCKKCEINYYPDDNGGCSYTEGCEISYRGECLQCKQNYILVGKDEDIKICKYLLSEIYKNCENINLETGKCEKCEEGYFLTSEQKCTKVEFCKESIYGNCISCKYSYYFDKKEEKCKKKEDKFDFFFCKQTIDGEKCDICDDGFYHDENGICVPTKYCLESDKLICIKCISGYYLSNNNCCSIANNCDYVDIFSFNCNFCQKNYYLDTKDFKCKSNLENNEFKFCKKVIDSKCVLCENDFYLGKDGRCSFSKNCLESENGLCLSCENDYYLGLDNNCTNVNHCIYSIYGECLECEDNYYYNRMNKTCVKWDKNFNNCKISCYYEDKCCECKNNFYLNSNNSLCYDNTNKGPFYKCAYSDDIGEKCDKCIEGYYLGSEDYKCSKIERCKKSENENKCLECDDNFCLDVKKQKCVYNNYLEEENDKLYINCLKTNEEGTKCEKCLDGYEIGNEGYCIDNKFCEEKNDEGICLKCKSGIGENEYHYCANNIFGCLKTRYDNCLRCDNMNNLYECTECIEGYIKKNYGCEIVQIGN